MARSLAIAVLAALLLLARQPEAARVPQLTSVIKWWNGPTNGQAVRDSGDVNKSTTCDEPTYRPSLLKLIREMPFIGLFDDVKKASKFEASGMTVANGWLWIVFDNLHSIGRVDEHFQFRDKHNALVGETGDDSQFEGLTYKNSTGHFFAVEEVVDDTRHGLVPYAQELALNDDGKSYAVVKRCPMLYEMSHANKGFEGLHFYEDGTGTEYLAGLCEGNFCAGGKKGRRSGNGRIVVTEHVDEGEGGCYWKVVKVVEIPPMADFVDYSDVAFHGDKSIQKVAITSQENSAMYVSWFDWDKLEFVPEMGEKLYHFPRNEQCKEVYCNVEGVQWLDDYRLVIASDKAKSDQHLRCTTKDQMIHIFALP